jgi:hypothetical protein
MTYLNYNHYQHLLSSIIYLVYSRVSYCLLKGENLFLNPPVTPVTRLHIHTLIHAIWHVPWMTWSGDHVPWMVYTGKSENRFSGTPMTEETSKNGKHSETTYKRSSETGDG